MTDTIEKVGTSRRDVLKKAAVVGAAAWAAPVITSSRAFADDYTVIERDACCDPVTGKAQFVSVSYRYTGNACDTAQFCVNEVPGGLVPTAYACTDSDVALTFPVTVTVSTGSLSPSPTVLNTTTDTFTGSGFGGDPTFTLTGANGEVRTVRYHFSCSQPLCVGDRHGPLTVVGAVTTPGTTCGVFSYTSSAQCKDPEGQGQKGRFHDDYPNCP